MVCYDVNEFFSTINHGNEWSKQDQIQIPKTYWYSYNTLISLLIQFDHLVWLIFNVEIRLVFTRINDHFHIKCFNVNNIQRNTKLKLDAIINILQNYNQNTKS